MNILPLFCDVDDFCLLFEPQWHRRLLQSGTVRRNKPSALALSEVMTILILFHSSGYRDLKTFYTQHVQQHLAGAFPRLVSYNRFVELQREALVPLWCYLQTRKGSCTGVAFVDATTLAVCHNLRIPQHKVFFDCARRGQSSMGWFYGFKLHLVINDCGEILGFYLTPGNVDDRKPVAHMVKEVLFFYFKRPIDPPVSSNNSNANVSNSQSNERLIIIWWDVTRSLYEAEKDKGLEWAINIISNLPPHSRYYLFPIHSETERPTPLGEGTIPDTSSPDTITTFRGNLKKRILESVDKLREAIKADGEASKNTTGIERRDKRTCILKTLNYSATLLDNESKQYQPEIIFISDMIEDCFHQNLNGGKGGFIQLTQQDVEAQIKAADALNLNLDLKKVHVTVIVPTASSDPISPQRPDIEGLKKFWKAIFNKCQISPENIQWAIGVLPSRFFGKDH
jgi:Transposase DDE domain